jgi:hypothetical protein
MDWTDQPATWKQIKYLRQLGCKPDHPLSKTEASKLIRDFGGQPETSAALEKKTSGERIEQGTAYDFRQMVEKAKQTLAETKRDDIEKAQQDLALAIAKRQGFWADTCRDQGRVLVASMAAHEFYQKYGCRFEVPTLKDVQCILDALDSAMPFWDRDHPELFYQTLELNFHELLRRP